MAIIFDNNSNYTISKEQMDVINQTVNCTAKNEKCPYEFEVSVTITSNDDIKILNKTYRAIDKITDVLSFPLIEFETPADFGFINEKEDYFNLDTSELVLGDIVLSWDKLLEQANTYGHSIERELGFLIVHSMLHLFGYDHMNSEDEKIMIDKQEKILDTIGLSR